MIYRANVGLGIRFCMERDQVDLTPLIGKCIFNSIQAGVAMAEIQLS